MKTKPALSATGFAIIIFILLGVAMIVSAPSFIDNSSKENEQKFSEQRLNEQNDFITRLQNFENQINQRLNAIEDNVNSINNNQSNISNKYICTIEGNVDEDGNIVKVNSQSGLTKFVFVCEYK